MRRSVKRKSARVVRVADPIEIYRNDRFVLRAWRVEDVASLAENADDMTLWQCVRDGFPHPYTVSDAEMFIASVLQKPEPWDFAIEVDGCAVGGVGFVPQGDVERFNAEVGYWIGLRTAVVAL